MGSLSQALGQTFDIPANQPQVQGQQRQAQGAQTQGGSIMGAPPTGLEHVTGVTEEFYKKWGDIESFASKMKMQYGIDVSRPDFSSDVAMEAHKIYQQGLADIRNQGNKLQQAQKDRTAYDKAYYGRFGSQLENTQQQGQVFDPEMVTNTGSAQPAPTGQVTQQDLYRTSRDKEAATLAFERKLKLEGVRKGNIANKTASYSRIAEDLGSLGAGVVKWDINEDGTQVSNMWKGKNYGTGKDNKIIGFELNKNGEKFLVYGGDRVNKQTRLPVNEDTIFDIYDGYIKGQYNTATERREASSYLESLEEQGLGIFDMAREDTEGYLKSSEEAAAKYKTGQVTKKVEELTEKANSGGNLSDFDELIGKGSPEVVGVDSRNRLQDGYYTITFADDSEVIIGGDVYGKNNQVIKEIMKSSGSLQQPEETVVADPSEEQYNALPSGAKFTYQGVEYTKQ